MEDKVSKLYLLDSKLADWERKLNSEEMGVEEVERKVLAQKEYFRQINDRIDNYSKHLDKFDHLISIFEEKANRNAGTDRAETIERIMKFYREYDAVKPNMTWIDEDSSLETFLKVLADYEAELHSILQKVKLM